MKIIYITNSRVPTEKAYGYQISKMCEEFADAKNEVELWTPVRQSNIKEDIFSFYNIKNNFKIKEIKSFDFLRYYNLFLIFSYNFSPSFLVFAVSKISTEFLLLLKVI